MSKRNLEETVSEYETLAKTSKIETLEYSDDSKTQDPFENHSETNQLLSTLDKPCWEEDFNRHFKEWSFARMEGDQIEFKLKGEVSALYSKIGCCVPTNSNNMFQFNNVGLFQQFCRDCYKKITTHASSKCHAHIFITGMVKSGKTTIAKEMFPFFYTRETNYTSYLVRYISFDVYSGPTLAENNAEEAYALKIVADILEVEHNLNFCQCLSSHNNALLNYLAKKPSTMHYIIFDGIQLANPKVLSILKTIFKIREISGRNILSIWTGGTQALVFKKIKMLSSNGYSFNDECLTYNISYDSDETNLKELRAFCNSRSKNYIVDQNCLRQGMF